MSNSIKKISFAAARVLFLALASASSSAHAQGDGSSSLADSARGKEGIYCGIECGDTAHKRWMNEHHVSASAPHGDWYGLVQSTVDTQLGQY